MCILKLVDKKLEKCKVSVIVPVYNVEDYIDECINSIVNQTFSEIEILLIVGQSTDNSMNKCEKWLQEDNRIRLINEKQHGLGPARNQGIDEAKGEYIVFVDSDDFIQPTYIEKMYNVIISEQADIVECDFSRIRSYTNCKEYSPCTKILKKELNIHNRFLLGNISMWKIMSKKELWSSYNIVQPEGVAEDFFTYPLLLFAAKKIVGISEDLYIYRKDRKGNASSNIIAVSSQITYRIKTLLDKCIKQGYFDQYENELDIYIRRWISRYCSPCLGKTDKNQYMEIKKRYLESYVTYFSSENIVSEIVWGGFNLSRIINKLSIFEDPYCRVNFTSIISIMSRRTIKYNIKHNNKYREFMLKREFQEDFFKLVAEQKTRYFFFDLLEERHDILKIGDMFFTKSDAFEEAEFDVENTIDIIKRNSLECQMLWESSCIIFFERLFQYISPQNVIMIKNYLMEQYGDGTEKYYFRELDEIRKINKILKNYYQFIKMKFPDISVIEINKEDEYYYTDINYEFGCYPWHLNEWENIKIAEQINKII